MPTFAVDLDGTLAPWDKNGNYSKEDFEPPYPGAKDFLRALSSIGGVIIFTARCNEDLHGGEPIFLQERRVENYLKLHGLPFDKVWVDKGKPVADVYFDDRGFRLRPADARLPEEAYIEALSKIKSLLML